MKADPRAQSLLVEISELDTTLSRLEHRRSTLAEQRVLDELRAEHDAARESAARSGIAVEDIDRAIGRLESDTAAVRARRTRDEELLAAGTLPPRQVSELDHELSTLARRQDELETEELELMSRREALVADVEHSGATISHLDERIGEATEARDRAAAELDESAGAAERRRAELAATVPTELLGLYNRITAETGRGLGLFTGGRCTACGLELDRSTISSVQAAPADEVVTCPECRAILVRSGAR